MQGSGTKISIRKSVLYISIHKKIYNLAFEGFLVQFRKKFIKIIRKIMELESISKIL